MIDLADLESAARNHLPRFVFYFVAGGSGHERALRNNVAALEAIRFNPKVLSGELPPATTTQLFGQSYAAPFGIAPIGMLGLVRAGAEVMLAQTARSHNIPMILSTAATQSIGEVAAVAGEVFWYQYYPTQSPALNDDLIARAQAVGCRTLMLTVDTPVPGRRLRDLRNGLHIPPKLTPKTLAQLAVRPRWALARARAGAPELANLKGAVGSSRRSFADTMKLLSAPSMTWEDVAKLRERWQGTLLVKGLLHPDDVSHCVRIGVDGVVLSNHGGRQLDSALAPVETLPMCREIAGDALKIIVDGGFRSGEDVAKGLALGADFVLLGRPFVYAAALGEQQITAMIELLVAQLVNTLSLAGVPMDRLPEVLAPAGLYGKGE